MSRRVVKRVERATDTSRVVLHVSTAELSAPTWVIEQGADKERRPDNIPITVPRLTRPA